MVEASRDAIANPVEIYWPFAPPLKWPEIQRVMYWYTGTLDDGIDTDSLLMLFVDNTSGTTIDADEDGDFLLRYDSQTGDVHGIAIEDFEHYFLKKHPEFSDGWASLKPEGKKGFHKTPWLTDDAALDYARRLKDMAHQGTLAPGWPFEDLDSIAVKWKDADTPSP